MAITKVTELRWKSAQEWELLQWQAEQGMRQKGFRSFLRLARRLVKRILTEELGDDWNHWWAEKFANYALVPEVIEHAIELGCGPYTNMRITSQTRKIHYLYCSDPLALEYIKLRGWLSNAYCKGRVLIDTHPAEECPYASGLFDLVVMINVLDHVFDAERCLQQAMRITKCDGLLVLGQDLTSSADIPDECDIDIGHPIRLTHDLLDAWLSGDFDPLLYSVLPREEGRNPEAHYGTYIYIGRKKKSNYDDPEGFRIPQ